jgi:hypothetical protein
MFDLSIGQDDQIHNHLSSKGQGSEKKKVREGKLPREYIRSRGPPG